MEIERERRSERAKIIKLTLKMLNMQPGGRLCRKIFMARLHDCIGLPP